MAVRDAAMSRFAGELEINRQGRNMGREALRGDRLGDFAGQQKGRRVQTTLPPKIKRPKIF